MKAAPFSYHAPQSVEDAVGLLSTLENARVLAGGQSLMPMMNLRLAAPDHLVDINRVPGLAGLRIGAGRIEIGAMTRQADLLASDDLAAAAPIFRAALKHVGHIQTRARGTIGGSCCHLDPAAELPALCALLDAQFEAFGPNGSRAVAARDWFRGYLESALAENEILCAIGFAPWPSGHGFGFHEVARRHGDFAVAGAAALLARDETGATKRAAVVVFGVEPAPVRLAAFERAIVGRTIDEAAIEAASEAARKLDAMGDAHVGADHRRRIGGVVVARALREAAGMNGGAK
ncbi:MAG: FAD binding domain-containing protein [Hyphomicrobiales bacterium]|nr:FAD binding domain-containing protein [Hyphomicrobiales bacterium]